MFSCTNKNQFENPEISQLPNGRAKDWVSFITRRIANSRKNHFNSLNQYHIEKEEAIESLKAHNSNDKNHITWIGHATFLIKIHEITILTDPFFSDVAGKFGFGPKRYVPLPINIDDIAKVDLIICTHNHYDHLDIKSLKKIRKKFGDCIQVLCPLGLAKYFYSAGFTKVTELNWYEKSRILGIEISCLPAIHNSGRSLFDKNQTLWCSFGLKTDSFTLYFSGDTAYDPKLFKKIHSFLGDCDLCILGIGSYEPEKLLGKFHANPEEAVKIAVDFNAKNIVGMHWGTLNLSDEPIDEPINRFNKSAYSSGFTSESIWLMKIGETRCITGCSFNTENISTNSELFIQDQKNNPIRPCRN
jgi:L-ascorbate metabolism protein UlaG (beta-lactamase superfamily)